MSKTFWLMGAAMTLGFAGPAMADNTSAGDGPFDPAVQLRSESGPINVGTRFQGVPRSGHGYAGPHIADLDADGTPDLLVGDIFGNIFFYRGLGNDSAAPYADPEPVRMADGDVLVLNNW